MGRTKKADDDKGRLSKFVVETEGEEKRKRREEKRNARK